MEKDCFFIAVQQSFYMRRELSNTERSRFHQWFKGADKRCY